jgi:hypothetical protein
MSDFQSSIIASGTVLPPCKNRRHRTELLRGSEGDVNVRFSNRPFGVKHFQTVHRCSVDVIAVASSFTAQAVIATENARLLTVVRANATKAQRRCRERRQQ